MRNFASSYLRTPNGALGTLLNGARRVSVAAWICPSSVSGTANLNHVIAARIGGSNLGGVVLTNGPSGVVRISARSQAADAAQTVDGTTAIQAGQLHHAGGVIDYQSAAITVYRNGRPESRAPVTFGASAYTHSATTTNDGIASAGDGISQFSGAIGQLALWRQELSPEDWDALASGVTPDQLDLQPVFYWPGLPADQGGLSDRASGTVLTEVGAVNGNIPADRHCPIRSRRRHPVPFFLPSAPPSGNRRRRIITQGAC